MENPNFLKNKYNLHNSPEVKKAAERTEKQASEKVPQDPEAQIQNYLDRLERIILDPNKEQQRKIFGGESRPRALLLLREMVMNKYVRSHKEKMAEGAARVEERAARELGIDAHYGEQELEQRGEIAVSDLEKSLDNWIAYLSDANEPYPVWFRYYAFRNILDLGDYDKDKREFPRRSQGTARLFPDIDRGALAYIQDIIEASKDSKKLERLRNAQEATGTPKEQLLTKEKAEKFTRLSFARQYVEGIKQAGEITPEMREETRGKWVKYQQGTDPTALWASLQNKGTAWCTKGFATAETQLKGGDFYVYYTLDRQGKPTIPRVAIRMQENQIFEARGVSDNQQNLEGNMTEIAEKKMNELPGAEKYRKVSADMKLLTEIEKKTLRQSPEQAKSLTKDELIFLYEINSQIEGFGYQRDPRIKEIRNQRNPREDAPIVFDCDPSEIAWKPEDINEKTKAYIGSLFKGIFQKNIENIYTSFPETRIEKAHMAIGGLTEKELEQNIENKKDNEGRNYQIYSYAKSMMKNPDFIKSVKERLKKPENITLVKLKIRDLGFTKNPTTDELYARAGELGLDLCPAETGPHLRLKYEEVFKREQPMNEYLRVAMKQIADSDGDPYVFYVHRDDGGFWLGLHWADPAYEWDLDYDFVFRLRKEF